MKPSEHKTVHARILSYAEAIGWTFVSREDVEPLGYKAFLVGVDREACALYKHALDEFLPAEYSEVVYTGSNNDWNGVYLGIMQLTRLR